MNRRLLSAAAALAALAGAALSAPPAAAQGYFGKNQVEYHHFTWQVIETEHFTIHYYPEEAAIAMDVARMSERAYTRLSRLFQWEFREKKPIMLFASRADFGENLVTGDLGEGTGGVTEALRDRMLFFFTGNYRTTEHVLTHEMVHEFQYDIFGRGKAGGGLQSLQAVNPPLWFMEGMAEYLSKGPDDPHTNVIIRDAVLNNNVPSMAQMTNQPDEYFPYRYGESFFAYVGRRWGDESVGTIMLETPSLGVERAFERNTGNTLNAIAADWKKAMQEQWLPVAARLGRARTIAVNVLNKHRTGGDVFVDPALSPDGKYVVFLSNGDFNKGEVFIDLWLADAQTGKRIKRLVKSTLDPNYQEIGLLYGQSAFSPDGTKLAFSALSNGQEVLQIIDVAKRKRIATIKPPLDGATGPTWSPDGTKIVFSGAKGGITDLWMVDADGKNLTQLTNDKEGDVMPSWSPDGRTIAFATERGPGLDLANLVFPLLHIALYHLDTKQIEVLPDQRGQNINPNWSPDGKTIAYISNGSGIPNICLYDVQTREQFQITNLVGGVTGITDVSPALSWAHDADRLAFSYYEDGKYTIWTVDDPRHLERLAVRPLAVAAAAAAAPAAPRDTVKPLPGIAGVPAASFYDAPGGYRAAAVLPAGKEAQEAPQMSVAAILDTGAVKLPDSTMFMKYPYKLSLAAEYSASPTIGYTKDNFGSGFYGGTAISFTDLTGGTRMNFAFAINGRLEDFMLQAQYVYLANRLQYAVGVYNVPFYYGIGSACDANGCITQTERYLERSVYGVAIYPLNTFERFEFGVNLNDLNREIVNFISNYDGTGGTQSFGATNKFYAQPMVAYVSDNTLYGYFAPISGHRYRLQFQPAVGGFSWMQEMVDYRRYEPIIFNKLIFGFYARGVFTQGRDADSINQYIGYAGAVRGYNGTSYAPTQTCLTDNPANYYRCNPMIGSSAWQSSVELRAPFYAGGGGGVPLPPVEMFIFGDIGQAWFTGQTVIFKPQSTLDPEYQRGFITAHGIGARVNLFGAAIMSWAFVWAHDINPQHPYVQFSLYAPF